MSYKFGAGGINRLRLVRSMIFPFFASVCFVLATAGSVSAQQQITVTGQVTDENGDPLPGATIVIEGTDQGTTSDIDGLYEITAAEDAVLVFSYVGYEAQRILVEGRERIDVNLMMASGLLDEVVVVGYGETSRKLLTTSISQIGGDHLERIPISNISEGLKGRISGMRIFDRSGLPGQEPIIEIRGGSSINRSNAPLVLVDGVERPLADLNPNDIENVTVLKDAASTAIYGSRASNGVVLVTTKRGERNVSTRITFESNTGFQRRIQDRDLMNAEEYVTFSRQALIPTHPNYAQYMNGNNQSASGGNNANSIYTTRYLQTGEEIPAGWKSIQDPLDPSRTLIFMDTNYQELMFGRAPWQNHNLSVSGGSENVTYRASLGYADDQGIALSSGWNRISARGNADVYIRENLIFSGDMNYSESDTKIFGNQLNAIIRGAYAIPPTQRPRWDDGTPTPGFNATAPNPLFYDYIHENENLEKNFGVGAKIYWLVMNKLEFTIDGRRYAYNQERSEFERAHQFRGDRPASFQTWRRNRTHLDAHFRYFDQVGDHSYSWMSGFSWMSTDLLTSNLQAIGAVSDKIFTLNASPEAVSHSTNLTEEKLLGFFGRVTYEYRGKYLMSGVFRADGSSRFAEGSRWGFFPGGSAAWIITEESFMENFREISLMKIRASLGLTGNNAVGLQDAFGVYSVNQPYAGHAGIRPTTMPNQDLRWESTRQIDIGIDLGLFNDRIIFAADYFNKLTDNLLFTVPLPNTTGFGNVIRNVGQVRYNGFELELSTVNIEKNNFSWSSQLTLGYVQNEVVRLPDNDRERNRIDGFVDANGNEFGGIAEGERLGRIYGYKVSHIIETQEQADNAHFDELSPGWSPIDGSFQSGRKKIGDWEWVDRDGNRRITTADQFVLGNEIPHTTGGLANSFLYKNWSLNIVLDWALGHSILDYARMWNFMGVFHNNYNLDRELLNNSWQQPGDNAKYAKWYPLEQQLGNNFDRPNDAFVYKGDYLAVREITMGYDFSSDLASKIGASSISVYASVHNLHYFTEVKGISPERGTFSTRHQDANNQGFPMVRRATLGVQLSF